jgi:hypothetical protein
VAPLSLDQPITVASGDAVDPADVIKDRHDDVGAAEGKIEAARIIGIAYVTAPEGVAEMLTLTAADFTFTDACEALGLSRFAMRRSIDKWAGENLEFAA